MNSANNSDESKLISDRGPAQPSGFADEGQKGPNSVSDQHPADNESMSQQDELKNTRPKRASPDESNSL